MCVRYFYINENGTIWNPGWSPVKTELDEYECRHGMGYTVITGKKNNLKAEVTFFVAQKRRLSHSSHLKSGVSGMHRMTAQTSRETSVPVV